jgi:hypothetical protein
VPWLLNEDAAIKAKFQGLFVTDSSAPPEGRPVAVRFTVPSYELATMDYPTIVISHSGISRASDREHRGSTFLPYIPEGFPKDTPGQDGQPYIPDGAISVDPSRSPFFIEDYPIPHNIDYQVVVYNRLEQHQTELTAALAAIDRIPSRFGYVEVPEDGTVRSLDLIGGPERVADKDENGKRVFKTHYAVRVYSELPLYAVQNVYELFKPVGEINILLSTLADSYEFGS